MDIQNSDNDDLIIFVGAKQQGRNFPLFFSMDKIKLNVLGISYSQTQSGAYALVLTEENGDRRIPIIIGGFEAQAIAIQLEGLNPPRPLTHDLFLSFATAFDISLIEVNIYRLEEGVFYSKLVCVYRDREVSIDARTSDAIALALRFKCPIYTTEEIMAQSGIVLDIENDVDDDSSDEEKFEPSTTTKSPLGDLDLKEHSDQELKEMLEEAIGKENYEKASQIRDELKRRKKD
jgi:bifunctional DNase/RNase